MKNKHWQIWVDTGGTFTDCIGLILKENTSMQDPEQQQTEREHRKVLGPNECTADAAWIDDGIYEGYDFKLLDRSHPPVKIESIVNGVIRLSQDILDEKFESKGFEITSSEEAPVMGARILTKTSLDKSFPKIDIKIGSTRGTNALLERKGANVTLITTKGFPTSSP